MKWMKKAKEKKAKEQKDMDESWQRMLNDSIKHNNEQRERAEKNNHEIEKFHWDCSMENIKENRKKEDRMIRIEAKLDELLMRNQEWLNSFKDNE